MGPPADGRDGRVDELRAYVKARVAAYKYPWHLWFVDSLHYCSRSAAPGA